MEDVRARIKELKAQAEAWFDDEAIEKVNRMIDIVLDARYVGQNFELAIGLGSADPLPSANDIQERFFIEHERAYGFHNPADRIEIVNFRLLAVGRLRQPTSTASKPRRDQGAKAGGRRKVWFSYENAQDTPVYDRAELMSGDAIEGPAVIEQLDSTTLLFPCDRATVDPHLNLIVELAA
jgi:N-methylhydantoinase A